ncbi:energy transducer TonB [Desulfosudis oleivorans]|uniref:TonB family protein n=1 Tax=Desulfosudis oleivorans (strain DSM 6200 / JCM 39069 / Hxd3) TaxID=96561 RepID=A8ZUI3_DESOH|nr:TonB family protein [Desulfosudis oleivorans]ABW68015.1 TonB family protein [Desulfosudis oleivorans Hxd3]
MAVSYHASLLDDRHTGSGSFAAWMSLSFGFHLLVLVLLVVSGSYSGCQKRSFPMGAISVDLVSLPGPASGPSKPAAVAGKTAPAPAPPVRESKAPAYEKPAVVPKPKAAVSTKKNTAPVKASPRTAPAAAPEAEDTGDAELAKTLADLEQKVSQTEQNVSISGQSNGPAGGGGTGAGGGRAASALEIYNVEMGFQIRKNWVSPMGVDENLQAVIAIHIAADGSLMDLRFEKRSGNDTYDESARKAILKSVPLPPLPKGFVLHRVNLEFTPKDAR